MRIELKQDSQMELIIEIDAILNLEIKFLNSKAKIFLLIWVITDENSVIYLQQ